MNYKRLAFLIAIPPGIVGWYLFWVMLFSTVWEPIEETNSWGSGAMVAFGFTLIAGVFGLTFCLMVGEIYSDSLKPWLHSCGCEYDRKCRKHRVDVIEVGPSKWHRKIDALEKELKVGKYADPS